MEQQFIKDGMVIRTTADAMAFVTATNAMIGSYQVNEQPTTPLWKRWLGLA